MFRLLFAALFVVASGSSLSAAPGHAKKCKFLIQVMYVKSSASFWETIYETTDFDDAFDAYQILKHYQSKGKLHQHVPPKGGWFAYDVRLVAVCDYVPIDLFSDSPEGPEWDSGATTRERDL